MRMGLTAALGAAVIYGLAIKQSILYYRDSTCVIMIVGGSASCFTIHQNINNIIRTRNRNVIIITTSYYVFSRIFCMLIVSPFTTVGIAVAISLSGVGSGAANLESVRLASGLAIADGKNSKELHCAHFIGSPKMSLMNVLANQKSLLPMMCTSAVLGVLAALQHPRNTSKVQGSVSWIIGSINARTEGGRMECDEYRYCDAYFRRCANRNTIRSFIRKVLKWIQPEDYN